MSFEFDILLSAVSYIFIKKNILNTRTRKVNSTHPGPDPVTSLCFNLYYIVHKYILYTHDIAYYSNIIYVNLVSSLIKIDRIFVQNNNFVYVISVKSNLRSAGSICV
jgi:hypothetical protein